VDEMQILGMAGSLRQGSLNRMLLDQVAQRLPAGTELVTWDGLAAIPPFSEDDEDRPAPAVPAFRAAIGAADAVLLVTPEYNGSIPGHLKNALDWASRPFPNNVLRGKPVAVVGASPSPGGAARAQADARKVLAAIGASVIDAQVRVARAHEQFDPDGRLVSCEVHGQLERLLAEIAVPRAAA
jgi:chromate reductase